VLGGVLEVVLEVALEDLVDVGMFVGQTGGTRTELPGAVPHEAPQGGRGERLLAVDVERVVHRGNDVPARIDEGSVEIKDDPPGRIHHYSNSLTSRRMRQPKLRVLDCRPKRAATQPRLVRLT